MAKRYNYPGAVIDEYESADGKALPRLSPSPPSVRRSVQQPPGPHHISHLPGTLLAPADMADANSLYSRFEGEARTKTRGVSGGDGRIVVSYVIHVAKCKREVALEGYKYCSREYTF